MMRQAKAGRFAASPRVARSGLRRCLVGAARPLRRIGVGSRRRSRPPPAGGGGKEEGYGYEFSDDPLSAGGFGPNDATIRVRPGPVRTTLIRPRTSFVPEMLKSVENL